MLAREKGCLVDGVTANQRQSESAKRLAAESGMTDRVRFSVADATDLPCEDGTYDGGWFLESIFYMGHEAALREARRVLKPGSVLVITDFVRLDATSREFTELLWDLLATAHIRKEQYPELLRGAGFELLDLVDVTREVIHMTEIKSREIVSAHREELLQVADEDYLAFVDQVNAQFVDNAGYVFVKARAV